MANQDGNIFAIAEDGEIRKLSTLSIDQVSISPDHRWLVLGNDSTLEIYSEADEITQTITKPGISEVVWRLDSSGFFFYSGKELYYKSMNSNDPVLLPLITQSGFIDLSSGKWVP